MRRTRRSTAAPRDGSPSSAGRRRASRPARSAPSRSGRHRGRSRTASPTSPRRRRARGARRGASRAGAPSARRACPSARRALPLAGSVKSICAGPAVLQVGLALDHVGEHRRGGVLEIGHEHLRAGIERVDDHLAVDRAGDLDPAVEEVGGDRRDLPVAFADRLVSARKSGVSPASNGFCRSARRPSSSSRRASKRRCRSARKAQRRRAQDFLEARTAGRREARPRNGRGSGHGETPASAKARGLVPIRNFARLGRAGPRGAKIFRAGGNAPPAGASRRRIAMRCAHTRRGRARPRSSRSGRRRAAGRCSRPRSARVRPMSFSSRSLHPARAGPASAGCDDRAGQPQRAPDDAAPSSARRREADETIDIGSPSGDRSPVRRRRGCASNASNRLLTTVALCAIRY